MNHKIMLLLLLIAFLTSGCFGREGQTVHVSVKSSEKQTKKEIRSRLGQFDHFRVTRCDASQDMMSFHVIGFFYGDNWDPDEYEESIEFGNGHQDAAQLAVSVTKTRDRIRVGTLCIFTLLSFLVPMIAGGSVVEAEEKRKSPNSISSIEQPRKLWQYPVSVIALLGGCIAVALIVALCEIFFAYAIPGIWSSGRGNYIVGGDYHAGTPFMVLVFGALIPTAIEIAVLAGLGALVAAMLVIVEFPSWLSAFIGILITFVVKLGSHHIFSGFGYEMWQAPWSREGKFGFLSFLYFLCWGLVFFAPFASATEEEQKNPVRGQ